jgi:hypothetical protein
MTDRWALLCRLFRGNPFLFELTGNLHRMTSDYSARGNLRNWPNGRHSVGDYQFSGGRMQGLWACIFTLAVIGNSFSQAPAAPHASVEPHVVRVQMGYSCGWCGGKFFYHSTLLTVQRGFAVQELRYSSNPKRLPNKTEKRAITRREWETLLRSIDAKALTAAAQDKTRRSCIDQPESWAVVEYSDGSKIAVHYSPTGEPAPVRALKIPFIPMTLHP